MKLLMVSGDRQVSIGERGPFHSMQREFSRYFERIDVICPRPDAPVTIQTIHDNVHFHPASCSRRRMVAYIAQRGSELIREHGHELIVSHDYGWFYNGIGSAKLSALTSVPYLSEIHHVPGVPVAADMRERFDRFVARLYVGWARSRARAFRVVNHEEMPVLLRRWGVPQNKILVLPSQYIDFDVFHCSEGRPEAERDIIYAGRMVNNKGVRQIIDAIDISRRKGRTLTATLIGRGPKLKELQQRTVDKQLNSQIEFIEWVDSPDELARLYRSSRLCVCASTCEGGPRFTVEAMACGTPVVSTPVGVMGELLGDGLAGALTGFDADRLAETMGAILAQEDRRVELGRVAVGRVQQFEYARALAGYANGLRSLVGHEALELEPQA
ncbi:MAG: glycosyltransferase involved in cell wall biosynthesis [Planctomycetota bacterium]|jgi:glycosyltransferase involved in cell wall biosynthesis